MKAISPGSMGLCAGLAACLAVGCGPRRVADGESLYAAVRRAAVFVLVDGRHTGSGFFADAQGLVVTAAHMVKGKPGTIEVISPVVRRFAPTVDPRTNHENTHRLQDLQHQPAP